MGNKKKVSVTPPPGGNTVTQVYLSEAIPHRMSWRSYLSASLVYSHYQFSLASRLFSLWPLGFSTVGGRAPAFLHGAPPPQDS